MSRYKDKIGKKAVALKYDNDQIAPVIVAAGMGHMAEKIVEVASDNSIPVYEDSSLATILSRLELGAEVPEELYKAIVDIYVYFLKFSPNLPNEAEADTEKR
ncbi:EscU/YscU/HrcU family type III secretion system export apparatus switch protein [Anaerotignum sp. MB30-C6]|uniref:EscU/YscU/HrcU family type III secretion system export apparatus switch protein n=1 Tax=Anaerotignum sp. MB30-C6 TaxID=3070814 RepID=UPI0027DE82E7|nr:EscU/YscU/HrcU family type III secretion system export apparatus switch protein [Anaerotignum sp. MB30-C6]WMI80999.1 EscU/YscU/HrcU family type III secretion system export apparatus switch protein [Anaerotignum sp. MB30-C6]